MMLSLSSIFTLQIDKDAEEDIVAVETLITKGIYRFTVLGMPTKTGADTKDRVYSALRSSGLLNLKSENRKIIVNLSPEHTQKKEGIYDLSIALSCISCIDQNFPSVRILALGGLSISGHIVPTYRLKHAIYTAYTHNIPVIVCNKKDLDSIDRNDVLNLQSCGIRIISSDSLKDAVDQLKNEYAVRTDVSMQKNPENSISRKISRYAMPDIDFENTFPLLRALEIALAGGHHILIQTPISFSTKQTCANICSYVQKRHVGREAHAAYKDKRRDIDPETGILYAENIKNYSKTSIEERKMPYRDSIVGLYTSCTCGYQYSFFEKNAGERRCICSQRLILQHRRSIQTTYFDLFNMHFMHIENNFSHEDAMADIAAAHALIHIVRNVQFERYAKEQGLSKEAVYMFKDNSYLNAYRDKVRLMHELEQDCGDLLERQVQTENILRIARTIQDIFDVFTYKGNVDRILKNQSLISRKALILSLSYMPKMDF
jgi:predicted ATPase with chaperone activity